jgi:hypothetical protein
MSFLNPWFLLALSAVSIPIIIHLFHFRRFRKVYFSNTRFLEQLTDETQKQARLRHLLVLISRILAIIFLVMAFARPYIPVDDSLMASEGNRVSIFVDNSFSMEAGSPYGTLLDHARQSAQEIIETFEPTDRFQLLTNDLEGRHQRFVNREEFLSMLAEVDFSPAVRTIPHMMERQLGLLGQEGGNVNAYAFILSDFQKNITEPEGLEPDTTVNHFFIPFQAQRPANVFIDSVWIDNPVRMRGQTITLMVRIFNDSEEILENQPVRLYINNTQRSVASFDIRPGSSVDVPLTWTIGQSAHQQGRVEITDHPVTFDDTFYFSFEISDLIPVLVIHQDRPNPFINALLGSDTTFLLQNVNISAIDFSVFSGQNLIILNEPRSIGDGLALELHRFLDSGGNLLIFPAESADLESYNRFLSSVNVNLYQALDTVSTRVTAINELHPVYTGVFDRIPENLDLPRVEQYYVFARQTATRDTWLMQLQNGNYFLTSTPVGNGRVYLSSVPASDNFSNFQRHAIFVPTLYNIALHSGSFYPLFYTLGIDESVSVRDATASSDQLFRIQGANMEVIPEARSVNNITSLILHGQIADAGNYQLMLGEQLQRILSFNYDRRESLLESYSPAELASVAAGMGQITIFEPGTLSFGKQMESFRGGQQLWKLFLILGLAFLFAEVLLLRFMR